MGAAVGHAAAAPSSSDALAESLQVAAAHAQEGRFGEAEPLLRRLLPQLKEQFGESSPEVAHAHDHLVTVLWRTGRGRAEETITLAEHAVALKLDIFGSDHLEIGESLFNLGIINAMGGAYSRADSIFGRVLALREAALPENHPDIAGVLRALANVRHLRADYQGAIDLYRRALVMIEASAGPSSEQAMTLRSSIAQSLGRLGQHAEAETLLQRQIELQEAANHQDLSMTINMLGILRGFARDHIGAANLQRRALAMAEAQAGPLAPWSVTIRANLAGNLVHLGEYTEARDLMESQVEMLESEDIETEDLANALETLANISFSLGDYDEELHLRQRCMDLRARILKEDHPRVAVAMINLAGVLGRTGRLEEQDALIQQARDIYMEYYDWGSPDLVWFLDGLGGMLVETGRHAEAKDAFTQSLKMREEMLGPDTPGIATTLYSLGRIAYLEGDLTAAQEHLERATDLRSSELGPDHPITAESALALAWVEFGTGDTNAAFERAVAAERILTPHLRLTLRALPERQALSYGELRSRNTDLLLSALEPVAAGPRVHSAWDAVIRSRAIVQDEMAARPRRWQADDPQQAERLETFRRASTRLANLYVRGAENSDRDVYATLLDEARREFEKAERELASSAGGGAGTLGAGDPLWPGIEEAVPDGCALLAFVRHHTGPIVLGEAERPAERYRAFVRSASGERVVSLDLGDAAELDRLLAVWSDEVSLGLFRRGRSAEEAAAACRERGRAVRRALWDPLVEYIGDAHTVFVVPDGQIHLVNLAALPGEGDRHLIEEGLLVHHLTAERDLLRDTSDLQAVSGALVLGAPEFGAVAQTHAAGDEQLYQGPRPECLELGSAQFEPLPGALQEARDVADYWRGRPDAPAASSPAPDVLLLTGSQAREDTFKRRAAGQWILHLATHGFVLDETCSQSPEGMRGIGLLIPDEEATAAEAEPAATKVARKNPMLLSGLALAGANRRAQVGPREEDGILTAQEIATLDLSATRWAILSACKTGTGSVRKGEGVLGLRRAFKIAGVRSLISSLWSVHDDDTRLWMSVFYRGIAEEGRSTAAAVREAALTVLRTRREEGRDTHPFHWAAFVASGDWR